MANHDGMGTEDLSSMVATGSSSSPSTSVTSPLFTSYSPDIPDVPNVSCSNTSSPENALPQSFVEIFQSEYITNADFLTEDLAQLMNRGDQTIQEGIKDCIMALSELPGKFNKDSIIAAGNDNLNQLVRLEMILVKLENSGEESLLIPSLNWLKNNDRVDMIQYMSIIALTSDALGSNLDRINETINDFCNSNDSPLQLDSPFLQGQKEAIFYNGIKHDINEFVLSIKDYMMIEVLDNGKVEKVNDFSMESYQDDIERWKEILKKAENKNVNIESILTSGLPKITDDKNNVRREVITWLAQNTHPGVGESEWASAFARIGNFVTTIGNKRERNSENAPVGEASVETASATKRPKLLANNQRRPDLVHMQENRYKQPLTPTGITL